MSDKTLSRWKQDIDGGDGGILTLCFMSGDVSVRLNSFKDAHALQAVIQQEIKTVRHDARAELLNQISRIQP